MQRDKLNEIAAKHEMHPIHDGMDHGMYIRYAIDLILIELELQKPSDVAPISRVEKRRPWGLFN